MQLSWSDPRLSVASDSRRTARYRLLQSWYREQVLKAEYGEYCADVIGATFYEFVDAGHWPQWEKPVEYVQVITDFLAA